MLPQWYIPLCLTLLGLVMGSAVTAIVYRIPRGLSWFAGRSACPRCHTPLGPLDLIPVLSWVFSLGRCRHCHEPIAWRYPATELLCGAWALLLYRHSGLDWAYPFLALWGFLLIGLMWIDYDFKLLPDALTFPGTLLGVAAALQRPSGAHDALLGVVAGSGALWLIAWAYLKVRRIEGMGGGDIKLAAMFGVVLGWPLTLLSLFLAALVGSVWGVALMLRRKGGALTELPFGTLLAPSALVAYLWGGNWVQWYVGLMRH
jgi:leader peptidase (prepilin peptidase)/N-methyltransferase